MREKISALLDDELSGSEQDNVLKAISCDTCLSETWQRYHLIRAALRAESIVHVHHLPERMAPLLSGKTAQARKRPAVSSAPIKWVPGLALAASIAGLAGLGLFYTMGQTTFDQPARVNQVVQADQGTQWESSTPDVEQMLNAFLVEHGEFAPPSGMNGLMAYAKFVSYDSTD